MLGSLLGGVLGDAKGAEYEFKRRGSYVVTEEMEHNTVFNLPAGSFTDDSSMMLCLATSLAERKTLDCGDVMEKFLAWRSRGYMSSCPKRGCFDIGHTTNMALSRYLHAKSAAARDGTAFDATRCFGGTDEFDAGNGGIMRLAPVPIFYWDDVELAIVMARRSSALTHACDECRDAAALMAIVLVKLLQGYTKEEALDTDVVESYCTAPKIKALCRGEYKAKTRDQISTSGYVVDSLEAALWCLHTSTTYKQGVLTLAGMGEDTDTVCCIYGQLAGALYGSDSLPPSWLDALQQRDTVLRVCYSLVQAALE